jgi:hypothetical protein
MNQSARIKRYGLTSEVISNESLVVVPDLSVSLASLFRQLVPKICGFTEMILLGFTQDGGSIVLLSEIYIHVYHIIIGTNGIVVGPLRFAVMIPSLSCRIFTVEFVEVVFCHFDVDAFCLCHYSAGPTYLECTCSVTVVMHGSIVYEEQLLSAPGVLYSSPLQDSSVGSRNFQTCFVLGCRKHFKYILLESQLISEKEQSWDVKEHTGWTSTSKKPLFHSPRCKWDENCWWEASFDVAICTCSKCSARSVPQVLPRHIGCCMLRMDVLAQVMFHHFYPKVDVNCIMDTDCRYIGVDHLHRGCKSLFSVCVAVANSMSAVYNILFLTTVDFMDGTAQVQLFCNLDEFSERAHLDRRDNSRLRFLNDVYSTGLTRLNRSFVDPGKYPLLGWKLSNKELMFNGMGSGRLDHPYLSVFICADEDATDIE